MVNKAYAPCPIVQRGNLFNIYLFRIAAQDLLARGIRRRLRMGLVNRKLLQNVTLFEMPYILTVGLIILEKSDL